MALLRPDVYVDETLRPNIAVTGPVSPSGAFIGQAWKGPVVPTLVNSWQEYVALYGGFSTDPAQFSWLPFAVNAYFSQGAGRCWVNRVVGSGAAAAAVVLDDRAGTPAETLTATADNVGIWGDDIHVKIITRDEDLGRFDLHVLYGGTTDAFVVERWSDLTMDTADIRYALNVVNSSDRGSKYVTLTNMDSETTAPDNMPAAGTFDLSGGDNGDAVDNDDLTAGIDGFDVVTVPILLNIPGQSSATVVNAALQYAEGRRDTWVVVDPPQANTPEQVITYAGTLTATSFGGLYYPWIVASDPSVSRVGVTRVMPPGGAVTGRIVVTDRNRGPHKAPAGLDARLAGAVDLETALTLTDLDNLNQAHVNALRPSPQAGVMIYGARCLIRSGADRTIPIRRTVIYLRDALTRLTQFAVFEPNDAALWEQITQKVTGFLSDFYAIGGLRGAKREEAYYVKCDAETNPLEVVEAGEVHLEVGVQLQYPAEFVVISLGQWEGGANAVEQFNS